MSLASLSNIASAEPRATGRARWPVVAGGCAIVAVAAATGAAAAVSGGIGFVGIVVPHLLRIVIGPDHRYLLPASALFGGVLMLGADMLARTIVAPTELPIGIITALAGAPFFLWVLLRDRTRNGW